MPISDGRRLRYAESRPDAALRPYVHSFWTFDVVQPADERFEHHVWPDGCVSVLIASRSGAPAMAMVAGAQAGPRTVPIHGSASFRGVRFRPEAGAAVLGVDVRRIGGRSQPLAELIAGTDRVRGTDLIRGTNPIGGDETAAGLARAVAEADTHREGLRRLRAWVRRRSDGVALDALVARAVDTLIDTHGHEPIAALAAACGLGVRQLERRFQRAVGVSPKQFARVRRMRSLIAAVLDHRAPWVSRAADGGYADQAHCARELSRLTGLSPRALELRLRAIEHDGVTP